MLSDGKTLAFTRYGLSVGGDNAVRYRGGRMGQLWRYTLGSDTEAVRLATDFARRSAAPWRGLAASTSSATSQAPTTSGR